MLSDSRCTSMIVKSSTLDANTKSDRIERVILVRFIHWLVDQMIVF